MSKVTVQTVMNQFNVTRDKVKQVKSMQLFIVDSPRYGRILVSYQTIIGLFIDGKWIITTEKFSLSTSRQTNSFIKSTMFEVERVNLEEFERLRFINIK